MSKVGDDILETLTGKKPQEKDVAKKLDKIEKSSDPVETEGPTLGKALESLEEAEAKIGPSSDEAIKGESTGESPEDPSTEVSPEVASVKASSGMAYVSRTYSKGNILTGEELDEELIPVQTLAQNVPQAKVHVDMSMTINMGDYNSVKIGVGIELPAYLSELQEAYIAGKSWVYTRLTDQVAEVKAHKAKRGS